MVEGVKWLGLLMMHVNSFHSRGDGHLICSTKEAVEDTLHAAASVFIEKQCHGFEWGA